MFVMHLREWSEGQWHQRTSLRISDAGRAMIQGDRSFLPTDLLVPAGGGQMVAFASDPLVWARGLPARLRFGPVQCVIEVDTDGPDEALTRHEAAALAGVAASTWSSQVSRGIAPQAIEGTSPRRWDRSTVQEWARRRAAAKKLLRS